MSEVQIFFVGMCMWWLTAPGPYVLIPELSTDPNAHYARITAAPSAFVGNACPSGFTTEDEGTCTYALNGKGAPGGVRIALLTNTPAGQFPEGAFCALPPLQRTTLYALKPAFTPPSGIGNAAWMSAVGGTPLSGVFPCDATQPDNCPRFERWTVPVTNGNVVLALDNLSSGAPVLAQLANGAQLVISNSPAGGSAEMHRAHRKLAATSPLDADDWCFYFRMIAIPGGPEPQCPGAPPIPPPCPEGAPPPVVQPLGLRFQTVACSNSQYP
jgi:hypothetical protein